MEHIGQTPRHDSVNRGGRKKIDKSMLATCQKLEYLNMFVLAARFKLLEARVAKAPLKQTDKFVKSLAKK